jgi:hypothetical protein
MPRSFTTASQKALTSATERARSSLALTAPSFLMSRETLEFSR